MVTLDQSVKQQAQVVPPRRAPMARHPERRAVVHLAAEYHGYARTGGLAEAVAGLANSQARAGERVFVFLPLYASVREAVARLPLLAPPHRMTMGPLEDDVRFYGDGARADAPRVIFVDVPSCFDRPGLYGDGLGDYPDNHLRFALFARAALHGIAQLVPGPRLLHAHDWHAALASVYMRTHRRSCRTSTAHPRSCRCTTQAIKGTSAPR